MATQYQYQYITKVSHMILIEKLNKLGKDGWHLINFYFCDGYFHGIISNEKEV